jgi:hypothetical protein
MADSDTGQSQDLDSILNEYDSKTQPPQAESQANDKLDKIYEAFQAQEQERLEQDINAAVETVNNEVDPDLVRGFLEIHASKDEDFKNAFANRKANPQKYQQALNKAKEAFNERVEKIVSKIDRKATEDTQEMVAAVSGNSSSKSEPEQPDFAKMSDEDFQKALSEI